MDEKDLIYQLKALKQIKPSQDWALLTKNRILGSTNPQISEFGAELLNRVKHFPALGWRFGLLKPAFALSALAVLIAFGVWLWGSLPGDTLYPAKKAVKQINLLTEDPVDINLRMAAESARALKEIAQKNEVDKLAPAMKEYEENVKRAVSSLDDSPKSGDQALKIAAQVSQIEEEAKAIEEILQTEIAKEERKEMIKKALAMLSAEVGELTEGRKVQIATQLEDLADMPLNEEQQGLLEKAQKEFESGEYDLAQSTINLIIEMFNHSKDAVK